MNIVQVSAGELKIPVEKGGGVENYILNISRRLAATGHNVTILDRKYSVADRDVEYIDGVKIVRLRARKFAIPNFTINLALNLISFTREVNKYMAKSDFDIVHVHVSISGLLLVILSPNLKKKLYYTSHATRRSKKSLSLFDRMVTSLENQLIKHSRMATVASDEMKAKMITETKINPDNIVVLPISIDIDSFTPNLDTRGIRRRYGLEGKATILFVGRIRAVKGVEYLIKAANIVVNEFNYKKARFVLVGPTGEFGSGESRRSPYLVKIMRLIENYRLQRVVKLTGPLPANDLRKLYAACDIFILPSLTESMASAPLEAMASGKPVIATKTFGIPTEVRDGQSGILIDLADERGLAQKIKYLIDNPDEAKRMGAYGRKLAEEEFDLSKIAQELLRIYETKAE